MPFLDCICPKIEKSYLFDKKFEAVIFSYLEYISKIEIQLEWDII